MTENKTTTALAWIFMLLTGFLPMIIWREYILRTSQTLQPGTGIFWFQVGGCLVFLAATFFWKAAQPLRKFFLLWLGILVVDGWLHSLVSNSHLWQSWFGGKGWSMGMFGEQLLRLAVSLVMIALLTILGFKRPDYFLVKGQLDAPAERVRWLGMKADEPWTKFGRTFAILISIGLIVFLVLGTRPTAQQLLTGLPFLPIAVIFAAMNAFSEEMTYRSALLAPLDVGTVKNTVVSKQNALWITALLFGFGHFYGVPYGWIGVAMASFLGYILGKSMLETRRFAWAWFIHILQDIIIFTPMAIGVVAAGGG